MHQPLLICQHATMHHYVNMAQAQVSISASMLHVDESVPAFTHPIELVQGIVCQSASAALRRPPGISAEGVSYHGDGLCSSGCSSFRAVAFCPAVAVALAAGGVSAALRRTCLWQNFCWLSATRSQGSI